MMELVWCKATQSWLRTEDTPLGGPCVKSHCGGAVVANLHSLWAACQEVQDPVAEGGVQTRGSELSIELRGNNSFEC
jgi:hypothetical protein